MAPPSAITGELEGVEIDAPHVVLLGAGASLAALPNGDKRGLKPPLLKNFVSTLGLESLLRSHGVSEPSDDFEALYSSLHGDSRYAALLAVLETRVYDYFAGFELPDEPTVYDHLLLSLRRKDVIATFNWDPLLAQAYDRNRPRISELPSLWFLHGSVRAGTCPNHIRRIGAPGIRCPDCGTPLAPSRLLFPVRQKNYSSDKFIAHAWAAVTAALKSGFALTVFGYGAPTSDIEAVDLLRKSWKRNRAQEFVDTEIVDIKAREKAGRDELEDHWKSFFFEGHYALHAEFYASSMAMDPRRSCEGMWKRNMEAQWIQSNPIPRDLPFDRLYSWLEPYLAAERADEARRQMQRRSGPPTRPSRGGNRPRRRKRAR